MSFKGLSLSELNELGRAYLPGRIGVEFVDVGEATVAGRIQIESHHLAPNGYLHAGSVVTLADSCCGYGCMITLPEGAAGFTTIELKSNFLGTALDGAIRCDARLIHPGRTTQVWDAEVTKEGDGKTIALFRCTQMILYPKG